MALPITDTEIATKISATGIRPSLQRMKVYEFLCRNPIHPTVDTVYTALHPAIPTLSRTTVYNTLKLLAEKKLVQTLTIENEELRYDADTSDHLHFKCKRCGEVYDVPLANIKSIHSYFNEQLPQGFFMEKIQTFMWGICGNCTDN